MNVPIVGSAALLSLPFSLALLFRGIYCPCRNYGRNEPLQIAKSLTRFARGGLLFFVSIALLTVQSSQMTLRYMTLKPHALVVTGVLAVAALLRVSNVLRQRDYSRLARPVLVLTILVTLFGDVGYFCFFSPVWMWITLVGWVTIGTVAMSSILVALIPSKNPVSDKEAQPELQLYAVGESYAGIVYVIAPSITVARDGHATLRA